MLSTTLLVAGAIVFCSGQPAEPRCTDAPVAAVTLTETHRATVARLAQDANLSRRAFSSDTGERWTVRDPRQRGDCEDRLLWAAQELRLLHPELTGAYRFVMVSDPIEGGRNRQGQRILHLVLVIEGADERIVIDTQARQARSWADYAVREAYTAHAGMGGSWTPYR